jgi:membrane-bound metal-dependent hydrolase YbcI (DUF457 family)
MFAGHIGAALAIGRSERRINVGAFVMAALLLDFVLWLFVLLGWESVVIPPDFAATHQPEYMFPFSHGLLASLVWSGLAGAAALVVCASLGRSRRRVATLVFAAVFSHWLLDAWVHAPELPIAGAGSARVGLGLWHNMPFALAVEALILIAGLALFLPGAALPRARKLWFAALCLLTLVFTVLGMTVAPPPPSARAMASSSLVTIGIVCALAYWLARPHDRPRT